MSKWQFSPNYSRFHMIPVKIHAGFLTKIDKLNLKFTWKSKRGKIAEMFYKKNKIRGLRLPDFKATAKPHTNQDSVVLA